MKTNNSMITKKFFYDEKDKMIKMSVYSDIEAIPRFNTYYEYDDNGNMIHTINPEHKYEVRSTYDERGNRILDTITEDSEVFAIKYEYDDHDRLIKEIEENEITEYVYSGDSTNVTTVRCSFGEITHEYDQYDNLTCVIDSRTGEKSYRNNEYDENNRLVRYTGDDSICENEYDTNGNLTKKTISWFTDDGHIYIRRINTYKYDEKNRCTDEIIEMLRSSV